jgi:hypothetical protein
MNHPTDYLNSEAAWRWVILANRRPEAMAELLNDLGERGRPGSIEKAAHASKLLVVGAGGAWAARTDPPAIPTGRLSPLHGTSRHSGAILARVIDDFGLDPVDHGALAEAGGRRQPGSPVHNVEEIS